MGRLNLLRAIVTPAAALSALVACTAMALAAQAGCADIGSDPTKLGVARVVDVDTTLGPILGKMTTLPHAPTFLNAYEVVLTFDDGPLPWITRSILDTLDRHCTHATFFSVGRMALAYPNVVREVIAHGHTLGTHTWSHPLNLKHLTAQAAHAEMERGFAAVTAAAGQPIAPFFRFPGLSDSAELVDYLADRHIASVTVDVVSNDSFINDAERLTRETLHKVDQNHGGIILFHDIKAVTAKALPGILDALAARGYSVVHLTTKASLETQSDLLAGYEPQVARTLAAAARTKHVMVPFFGTIGPERVSHTPTGALGDAPSSAGGWSTRVRREH